VLPMIILPGQRQTLVVKSESVVCRGIVGTRAPGGGRIKKSPFSSGIPPSAQIGEDPLVGGADLAQENQEIKEGGRKKILEGIICYFAKGYPPWGASEGE